MMPKKNGKPQDSKNTPPFVELSLRVQRTPVGSRYFNDGRLTSSPWWDRCFPGTP